MKKFEEITHMDMATPRYRRAVQFTNQVQMLLRDFLPSDRIVRRRVEETLMQIGWENNLEIVPVRPEWDELNAAQMAQAMLENHPIMLKAGPLTMKPIAPDAAQS